MKQNPCTVVRKVAKPTRIGLDELDGTVEVFYAGVADFVLHLRARPAMVLLDEPSVGLTACRTQEFKHLPDSEFA